MLLSKQDNDVIDGVAFADAAGVKLNMGMVGKPNGAVCRIENDLLPADLLPQRLKLRLRRNAAMVEEESPGAHQRADGGVEGSAGAAAPIERSAEEGEGFWIGGDGVVRGFAVDPGELAARLIVAKQSFDPVDLIEADLHPLIGSL